MISQKRNQLSEEILLHLLFSEKNMAAFIIFSKTIKQEGCLSSISIDLTSTLQVQELRESVQYKIPILLAYKNTLNSLFF